MTQPLIFKTADLQDEFYTLNAVLQLMVKMFCEYSYVNFGKMPVITRIKEKVEGSSGVHEAGRGVDFRDEHKGKSFFSDVEREAITNYINGIFPRNDGRKTVMFHSFQKGPMHVHMQLPKSIEVFNV